LRLPRRRRNHLFLAFWRLTVFFSRTIAISTLALSLVLSSAGCKNKKKPTDFSHELEPGRVALEKISPAEYPPFKLSQNNLADLRKSIDYSLSYMSAPSSQKYYPYLDITHQRSVATLYAMRELVDQQIARGSVDNAAVDAAIRDRFEVYRSIGGFNPDVGYTRTVLFTGYYTPIFDASPVQTAEFRYPLYKRPADLLTDPEGITASRRTPDGNYVLYYTREEIENGGALRGQEFMWVRSRWEAYIITIQGSAKLRLPSGQILEVGYAGNNGHPYVSPGKRMLADGKITKDQLSLKGLTTYFEQNPADMDTYLNLNPRFVFFTERPGGPFGSLNVPVTPFATIATDKTVYPRAMPSFLVTQIPAAGGATQNDYSGFMMDQDTGGAIRAAGRTDIFMGIGPGAEAIAGYQLHEGKLYYVAVKPELIEKYLRGGNIAAVD
jgi:membrane-bound lytic murein transglycosylase A